MNQKAYLISLIDIMVGLTQQEKRDLDNMDLRKIEFKYKMVLTEKTDEMIG
ncbi:hypothetical protein ACY2DA_13330 [Staphylococcus simulans]|nr:hypothetical protein [Staphylococcus aureus]